MDNQSDVFNFGAEEFNIQDVYKHYYSNVSIRRALPFLVPLKPCYFLMGMTSLTIFCLGKALPDTVFHWDVLLRCPARVRRERVAGGNRQVDKENAEGRIAGSETLQPEHARGEAQGEEIDYVDTNWGRSQEKSGDRGEQGSSCPYIVTDVYKLIITNKLKVSQMTTFHCELLLHGHWLKMLWGGLLMMMVHWLLILWRHYSWCCCVAISLVLFNLPLDVNVDEFLLAWIQSREEFALENFLSIEGWVRHHCEDFDEAEDAAFAHIGVGVVDYLSEVLCLLY